MKKGAFIKRAWNLIKSTFSTWLAVDAFQLSAALTFYGLLSLAPILLVLVSIAGFMAEKAVIQNTLFSQLSEFIEPKGIELLKQALENIAVDSSNTWALIIGLGAILLGSTAVISQLKGALNRIWSVGTAPHVSQVWSYMLTRLWALLVVGVMGGGLVALLFLSSLTTALRGWISSYVPLSPEMIAAFSLVLFIIFFSLLWALILKILVDVKLPWSCALWGGVVTAVLLQLSKSGISLYIKSNSIGAVYGAAGSLALLLLWVYYSSLVLLLGACFTRALMQDCSVPFKVKRHATRMHWEVFSEK